LKTAGGKTMLDAIANDYADIQRAAGNNAPKFDINLSGNNENLQGSVTATLLALGADQTNTRNFINPVGWKITQETIAQSKAHVDTHVKDMLANLQQEKTLAGQDKKEAGPLDGFQKQIDSANEAREKQFAEWATQTEAIVKRGQEINDEVIKLKEQGAKLLEEQKAIQDKLGPQIEAIKAEAKKCEDKFKLMADELEVLVESIKNRIEDVSTSVKTEETTISTLTEEVKGVRIDKGLNLNTFEQTVEPGVEDIENKEYVQKLLKTLPDNIRVFLEKYFYEGKWNYDIKESYILRMKLI